MNVCQSIIVASRLFADREAIVFEGRGFTFGQVEALSARAAEVLSELGIGRQDRVGIVIPNVPAFAVWYFACLRLGAIAVSVNTRLTGEEVAFMLSDCDAKVVVGTNEYLDRIADELPGCIEQVLTVSEDAVFCDGQSLDEGVGIDNGSFANMEPDDPATILYTSGTTGFPKGATLSHRNIRATVHAFNHLCDMRTDDRLLLAVPLFHCYGQNAILNAGFNVGATIVLQRGFDLNESRRLIVDHQVTKLFGVPTTFQLILESCEPHELSSIEYCFSAAATLPVQVSQRWLAKFGMPIFEGYGLTETAPFASYNHRLKYVPGSLGTPVDLVEMKIVDPDSGQQCPPKCPGEILIRGPNVMLGYWNQPEETASAIRDGWFHSGDIGETDEQGYFYIVDRLKDMIVVGGLKVFPAEVERVLLEHPAVSEAAVVGFADELLGEKVVAFVVGHRDGAGTANEIREHCRPHLASYKVPASIVFADTLPRNAAGKVRKTELRGLKLSLSERDPLHATPTKSAEPDDTDVTASSNLQAKGNNSLRIVQLLHATHAANRVRTLTSHIQAEVQHLAGLKEAPHADATFMETGMDSLMMVEFRDRLQRQLGSQVELAATIVFDYPTAAILAVYLVDSLDDGPKRSNSAPVVTADRQMLDNSPLDWKKRIAEMSEETALVALMRELEE